MEERRTSKSYTTFSNKIEFEKLAERILNLAKAFNVFSFNPEAARQYALFVAGRCPVGFALSALDTIQTERFPNPSDIVTEALRLKAKSRPSDRWVKVERSEGEGNLVQRVRRVQEGQDFKSAVRVGETLIRTYPGPEGW